MGELHTIASNGNLNVVKKALKRDKDAFLAIDEALGTSDAYFTKKASKKFDEFVNSSSILLLASHSEDLLKKYCTKAILLVNGKIILNGSLSSVLDAYNRL